jgi:hypothetical protein
MTAGWGAYEGVAIPDRVRSKHILYGISRLHLGMLGETVK